MVPKFHADNTCAVHIDQRRFTAEQQRLQEAHLKRTSDDEESDHDDFMTSSDDDGKEEADDENLAKASEDKNVMAQRNEPQNEELVKAPGDKHVMVRRKEPLGFIRFLERKEIQPLHDEHAKQMKEREMMRLQSAHKALQTMRQETEQMKQDQEQMRKETERIKQDQEQCSRQHHDEQDQEQCNRQCQRDEEQEQYDDQPCLPPSDGNQDDASDDDAGHGGWGAPGKEHVMDLLYECKAKLEQEALRIQKDHKDKLLAINEEQGKLAGEMKKLKQQQKELEDKCREPFQVKIEELNNKTKELKAEIKKHQTEIENNKVALEAAEKSVPAQHLQGCRDHTLKKKDNFTKLMAKAEEQLTCTVDQMSKVQQEIKVALQSSKELKTIAKQIKDNETTQERMNIEAAKVQESQQAAAKEHQNKNNAELKEMEDVFAKVKGYLDKYM